MILYIDDKTDFLEKVKGCIKPDQLCFLQHSFKLNQEYLDQDLSLIICDIHMPIIDGFEVYKMFRKKSSRIYFLFLSQDDSHQTVSRTLNLYNCSFISRDISHGHLKAIIQSQLNVHGKNFRLCGKQFTATIYENTVSLTPIEYKILLALEETNNNIPKDHLKLIVWDKTCVSDRTINTHIGNLRAKLKEYDLDLKINRNGYVELHL